MFTFPVEITVRGPIDMRTGMVMNITELKTALDKVVFKDLDHKNLDQDVDFFKKTVSVIKKIVLLIFLIKYFTF